MPSRKTVTALIQPNLGENSPVAILRELVAEEPLPGVIPWACPVLSFGDFGSAQVASVGLNPSSREFVNENGTELKGRERRFHTLGSLGISSWGEATDDHLTQIWELCRGYFHRRPYDAWFRQLEYLISDTGASYYRNDALNACHLDLIPFATRRKWGELPLAQRSHLLDRCRAILGILVKRSTIRVLLLNGSSVVRAVQVLGQVELSEKVAPAWGLRSGTRKVIGLAFRGVIKQWDGVDLGRGVLVLGYNHNIQSSYGVTRQARLALRNWIGESVRGVCQ